MEEPTEMENGGILLMKFGQTKGERMKEIKKRKN